jgi:cyclopropane fatty-acyl-phospholipid synthase-like methyltransferase
MLFLKSFIRSIRQSSIGKKLSISYTNPFILNDTQKMFLQWNSERLGISLEECRNRYFTSWASVNGGHVGSQYRKYCDLSYELFQVFFSDSSSEVHEAYQFHGPMHFLRMLSYTEPEWNENEIIIQKLKARSEVNILDYGCGLAQRSRTLAKFLKDRNVTVNLFLADIPTIRKEFLLWLGAKTGITTTFLDCKANEPYDKLPSCDICIATEFFEHVHDPVRYFDKIHYALNNTGILETNISDHKKEFMHVSPNLDALRERIRILGYDELLPDILYEKKEISVLSK